MAEEITNTQKIIDTEVLGEKIVEALETTYDPEIPVDIYELGLVHDVFVNEGCDAKISMTLIPPNCLVADVLPMEAKEKVQSTDDVHETTAELTFGPPWRQDMMSEIAKLELGLSQTN